MKKLLIIITAILLLMLLVASSVRFDTNGENILIDAGKPHKIVWPCKIDFVGEEGEKGFRIGPNVDQGWGNTRWDDGGKAADPVNTTGYAIYNFFAPSDGEYTLWGYALWDDVCTNAVFAQIDQKKKTILGNDPVYKKWHWVRGSSTSLTKGSHTLTLSNHSNNVALQKIMLMGSKYKVPSECETYFTDIFYDDFDGCDLGNFQLWKKISGNWRVAGNGKDNQENNFLVGKSTASSGCEIKLDGSQWGNYSFDIDITFQKWGQGAAAQIRFGENIQSGLFSIKITPSSLGQHNLHLLKSGDQGDTVLAKCETSKTTFKLSLEMGKEMILLLDDKEVIRTDAQSFHGGIKLLLEGEILASFDNLHIRYLESGQ